MKTQHRQNACLRKLIRECDQRLKSLHASSLVSSLSEHVNAATAGGWELGRATHALRSVPAWEEKRNRWDIFLLNTNAFFVLC